MNYGTLKTNFQSILNRRDITPTQVETFMGFGIQRIQRELRVPAMEKKVYHLTDGTPTVPIPTDLLELISLTHITAYRADKLVKVDIERGLQASMQPGDPTVFYRDVGNFILGPCPPAGQQIHYNYYADASNLGADTDFNWLTDAAPDLLIYAALTYAGDFFLDERLQRFENRYVQIAQSLQQMGQEDDLVNASITPQWSCA
jgi:hypothetical protein